MSEGASPGFPSSAAGSLAPGSLVIDRIETTALRAPLGRRFSGSAYSMDNRCTIIVRHALPDRPGFGIELDRDYVLAHTVGTRVSGR